MVKFMIFNICFYFGLFFGLSMSLKKPVEYSGVKEEEHRVLVTEEVRKVVETKEFKPATYETPIEVKEVEEDLHHSQNSEEACDHSLDFDMAFGIARDCEIDSWRAGMRGDPVGHISIEPRTINTCSVDKIMSLARERLQGWVDGLAVKNIEPRGERGSSYAIECYYDIANYTTRVAQEKENEQSSSN